MTHRRSYWKTTALAFAATGLCATVFAVMAMRMEPGLPRSLSIALVALAATVPALIGAGGVVCLLRDSRIRAGLSDWYATSANRVPAPGIFARFGLRFLLGSALRPGDIVQVRPLGEIAATLDADRCLEGLPFMREMEIFCNATFLVHRRVDKINDMRHKTGLRRLCGAVTLTGVRCDGSAHDDCNAECQILWKDAWLKRVGSVRMPAESIRAPQISGSSAAGANYLCQMTRLWEASKPMSRFDIRQDLRPLLLGNVGPLAYAIALLTRAFNVAQRLRRGVDFPFTGCATAGAVRPVTVELPRGAVVRIRPVEAIAPTLVNGRNRGLWFDREMVRFCGQRAKVRKRIGRLVHEATGKMIVMKTPSVTLEGIVATGEFLRLCPQHEFIFWREDWLQPVDVDSTCGATHAAEVDNRG